jgi:hypothetical protein
MRAARRRRDDDGGAGRRAPSAGGKKLLAAAEFLTEIPHGTLPPLHLPAVAVAVPLPGAPAALSPLAATAATLPPGAAEEGAAPAPAAGGAPAAAGQEAEPAAPTGAAEGAAASADLAPAPPPRAARRRPTSSLAAFAADILGPAVLNPPDATSPDAQAATAVEPFEEPEPLIRVRGPAHRRIVARGARASPLFRAVMQREGVIDARLILAPSRT